MSLPALYDVPAPAKLNLFLHVVGRRADGYHLINSLMLPIDWCDTLHFERRSDGRLARHDLGDPLRPTTSACAPPGPCSTQPERRSAPTSRSKSACPRAPAWAAAAPTRPRPCSPSTASGASTGRSRASCRIGLALGADLPFFLGGRPARVGGIGERLTPVALAPAWFAVVKPAAGLETARVFGSRAGGGSRRGC